VGGWVGGWVGQQTVVRGLVLRGGGFCCRNHAAGDRSGKSARARSHLPRGLGLLYERLEVGAALGGGPRHVRLGGLLGGRQPLGPGGRGGSGVAVGGWGGGCGGGADQEGGVKRDGEWEGVGGGGRSGRRPQKRSTFEKHVTVLPADPQKAVEANLAVLINARAARTTREAIHSASTAAETPAGVWGGESSDARAVGLDGSARTSSLCWASAPVWPPSSLCYLCFFNVFSQQNTHLQPPRLPGWCPRPPLPFPNTPVNS